MEDCCCEDVLALCLSYVSFTVNLIGSVYGGLCIRTSVNPTQVQSFATENGLSAARGIGSCLRAT